MLSQKVIDLIEEDRTIWDKWPLEQLTAQGELQAWFHRGFWQPMDTMRDKTYLEQLCAEGKAPWKVWEQAT